MEVESGVLFFTLGFYVRKKRHCVRLYLSFPTSVSEARLLGHSHSDPELWAQGHVHLALALCSGPLENMTRCLRMLLEKPRLSAQTAPHLYVPPGLFPLSPPQAL